MPNHASSETLPEEIRSEEALDEILTRPSQRLVDFIREIRSPLLVLGASGKMGPSLCALASRAAEAADHDLKVIAVSRFSDAKSRRWLEERGVETQACDLLVREEVARLPDAQDIVYLVGMKFGTRQNPALTWAVNTLAPSNVAERYPAGRIVAMSTGNVYPLVPVRGGGAVENDPPLPVGEYGSSALARERLLEYHSRLRNTPMTVLRLNYAVEMRYGVLVDIGQKVWKGEPIDLSTGYLNCIWQGDANEAILRSLALVSTPPAVLNLTGPEVLSVRKLAEKLGKLMDRPPRFVGIEAETALLSNAASLFNKLGQPATPLDRVLRWSAHWIMHGGASLSKPTHFEERTGQF